MSHNKLSEKNSRRGFISKLSSLGTAFIGGNELMNADSDENEKIKVLTSDGQLVEVDASIVTQNEKKEKLSNLELFKWSQSKQDNLKK